MNMRSFAAAALLLAFGMSGFATDIKPAAPAETVHVPVPLGGFITSLGLYIIGPADVVTVTVWKEPTLTGNILVRPDGMISMPLIGDIQAAGRTPQQLADVITDALKNYIQDPRVSVVLAQNNSNRIYVLGEVGRKGPIQLTAEMRLLEAIATAGGLTDFANQRKIYILRGHEGQQTRVAVKYKAAIKGENNYNILLQAGDTIVVP
jgi:polysaccharide biosynthesis/export protein